MGLTNSFIQHLIFRMRKIKWLNSERRWRIIQFLKTFMLTNRTILQRISLMKKKIPISKRKICRKLRPANFLVIDSEGFFYLFSITFFFLRKEASTNIHLHLLLHLLGLRTQLLLWIHGLTVWLFLLNIRNEKLTLFLSTYPTKILLISNASTHPLISMIIIYVGILYLKYIILLHIYRIGSLKTP